jgi:hypothetical protein
MEMRETPAFLHAVVGTTENPSPPPHETLSLQAALETVEPLMETDMVVRDSPTVGLLVLLP